METGFGVRFLVTGAYQANFFLLSICNRHSVHLIFWRMGMHLLIIRILKYSVIIIIKKKKIYGLQETKSEDSSVLHLAKSKLDLDIEDSAIYRLSSCWQCANSQQTSHSSQSHVIRALATSQQRSTKIEENRYCCEGGSHQ